MRLIIIVEIIRSVMLHHRLYRHLHVNNGEVVVSVNVVRMRANRLAEALLRLFHARLSRRIALVQLVGPGQQNRAEVVQCARVARPQSAIKRQLFYIIILFKKKTLLPYSLESRREL